MSIFDKLPGAHNDGASQPVQPVNTVSDGTWAKVMQAPSDKRYPNNINAWLTNLHGPAVAEEAN